MTVPEILARGPFAPGSLEVTWRPAAPLAPHAAARIEDRWSTYLNDAAQAGAMLFNGPIASLSAYSLSANPPRLHLTLTPSDYKTFVVTTLRDRPWFQSHAPHAITPALGNSILLTHAGRAVLGVRSPRVSAYAGHAHLIGGVVDVERAPTATDARPLLHHLLREIQEETTLLPHQLSQPTILALVRDHHLAQPELIWHAQILTNLPAKLSAPNTPDPEHDHFLLIDDLNSSPHPLTPVARLAWELAH